MEELKRCTRSCSRAVADNGALGRRLSPRLHNNVKANIAMPSSRLHKNCLILPSREPSLRGTISHKSSQCYAVESSPESNFQIIADSPKTQSPNILSTAPNFRRRLSPRLHHRDIATEKPSKYSSISIGGSQMQPRISPRLHKIVEGRDPVGKSEEPSLQRRVSPRLHNDRENQKRKPNDSTPQRGVSLRLHTKQTPNSKRSRSASHKNNSFSNAKRSKPVDNGCERKLKRLYLNGSAAAVNDELPASVVEQKAKINGDAPVVSGRSIHARVNKTLRIFNTCYLQSVQDKNVKQTSSQPDLKEISKFVRGCPSKTSSELPGLVCCDISDGQEAIFIPVTNLYDDAYIDEAFTYIKTVEVAESVNPPPSAAGCACKGNCTNPKICACSKLNGSDFPYVRRDGGRLVEAKDVVVECGPNCSCGPGCLNRTSQRGIKYHLEVYRTPDKGWAVRSWDFIPSGAPVCEYIGVVRRNDEVDNISGNDFIFEIDCWHTMNGIEGRERRSGQAPVSAICVWPRIEDKSLDSAPEFCIDAGSRGNVARFINHSCEPNLFVQCVLSAHHDLRLARLVLFAAEDIPPMQELTYDYGYALNSVIGPDGKVKALPCFCGTTDCRKRLY